MTVRAINNHLVHEKMSSLFAGLGASILSPIPTHREAERNKSASEVELNGESACRDPSPEEKGGKDKVVYGEYLEDHHILLNRHKFLLQRP